MTFIFVRLQSAMHGVMTAEEGQGLTEYALILALITVVAITATKFLGSRITTELTSVATSL